MTIAEEAVREYLQRGHKRLPTVAEIVHDTGYPRSTVYAALRTLQAERVRIGKNEYGYRISEEEAVPYPSVYGSLGFIGGLSWMRSAEHAMLLVSSTTLDDMYNPGEYADGFEALGHRFLELAAHARAVEDRPDWRIVLGFDIDTTKEEKNG